MTEVFRRTAVESYSMKKLYYILFFIGFIGATTAQDDKLIRVKILDIDGDPIPFALVIPDNDTIPIYVSDFDGEGCFHAKDGLRTIGVKMIRFNDTSIVYNPNQNDYHLTMTKKEYYSISIHISNNNISYDFSDFCNIFPTHFTELHYLYENDDLEDEQELYDTLIYQLECPLAKPRNGYDLFFQTFNKAVNDIKFDSVIMDFSVSKLGTIWISNTSGIVGKSRKQFEDAFISTDQWKSAVWYFFRDHPVETKYRFKIFRE